MADQKEELVNGIESIELATITNGVIDNNWIRMHNVADGSVSLTSNADTRTVITPEDKDAPIIILYTPGDLDSLNFGGYEISHDNLNRFFNILYDPTTSLVTVLSKKKVANLAIRLTSRAQYGVKKQFVYRNTSCNPTFTGNITKTGLLVLSIVASIGTWLTDDLQEALWTVQKLNEDGTPVNSVSSFDTTQVFASSVTATSEGITTTVAATDADTKFEFNKIEDIVGTPQTMTLKVGGVQVAAIAFPSDYIGQPFKFTDATSNVFYGDFANGIVNL